MTTLPIGATRRQALTDPVGFAESVEQANGLLVGALTPEDLDAMARWGLSLIVKFVPALNDLPAYYRYSVQSAA